MKYILPSLQYRVMTLLVLVNFNARIRKVSHNLSPRIIASYSYHQNANGSGERLGSLCENSKVYLLFIVKHIKIITCELGNVQMVYTAQIDHITEKKMENSIQKCRAYSTFDLDSDHRIVTANQKISFLVPRADQKTLMGHSSSQQLK